MPGTTTSRHAGRTALIVGLTTLLVSCGGQTGSGPAGTGTPASSAEVSAHPLKVVKSFTAQSLGLTRPDALVIAPNGNLYVTDLSQRVTVISPQGHVLLRWGKAGSGPGQFRFVSADMSGDPGDIAGKVAVAPDGTVYVADSGNARVQVFTPQGRFLRQFGSFGTDRGQFVFPVDLVTDGIGNTYVVDGQEQTMSTYDSRGKLLWRIGGNSSDPDLVGHFHVSMIDSHGRLVLTNDGNGRVLYIDASGHKVDAFGGSGVLVKDATCDVTIDALGYTYVTPCGLGGTTFVFDRKRRLVGRWASWHGGLLIAPRFGRGGDGFALTRDGSLLRVRPTLGRS